MFTQLDPPIPMEVDGRKGLAIGVIDYGIEYHLYWVVAYDDSREVWCVPNPKVRMQTNITYGRLAPGERRSFHSGSLRALSESRDSPQDG